MHSDAIREDTGREVPTERKVAFLSDPRNHPRQPARVEVEETHMSWVFLAAHRVLKMKKPVRYAFLDFSTLQARQHFVAEEIRLNRRLAPDVYLGARALTRDASGALRLGGAGEVVEWLVEMRRLPENRLLDRMLAAGEARPGDIERVGHVLAEFYRGLAPESLAPGEIARRFEDEHAETARVLLDERLGFDGGRVAKALAGVETALDLARPLLDRRAAEGRIVEGHGDLRPEHVCLEDPPVIIDCLDFDRRLRLVDPFEEVVFLGLECAREGADWILPLLCGTLAGGLGDDPPVELLRLYWQYRALLRARLALLHLAEPEPRKPAKWRPLAWRYVELAEQAEIRFRSREDR